MNTNQHAAPGVYTNRDELIAVRRHTQNAGTEQRINAPTALLGEAPSRLRGAGITVEEVRRYQPGDDVRAIDWRVSARTGVTHTKVFNSERERPVYLLLDQRSGMFFGSGDVFKSVFAARLAARLAWDTLGSGERLGGQILSDDENPVYPALRGRAAVLRLINAICAANQRLPGNDSRAKNFPPGTSNSSATLSTCLTRSLQVTATGSHLIVISDFHGFDSRAADQLAMLSLRRQLTLCCVADPIEQSFAVSGRLGISNGRDRATISVSGRFRSHYLKQRELATQRLHEAAQRCRTTLVHAVTDSTPDVVLAQMRVSQ